MHPPTTLITGAALRIGAGIAEHLAARGHGLVLHYRQSREPAEALGARLRAEYGVAVTLIAADLAQPISADFWAELPPVTHFIHNASRFTRDTLSSFQPEDLRAHLALHVEAPMVLTQGFLAQLPDGARGTVTVLGDGCKGWSISPEFFTYAISRYAWESLIQLLAAAAAPRARANLIALGPTLENTHDPQGLFDRLATRAPLQRTSSLDAVCQALDYLLGAADVTGQTLSLAAGAGLPVLRP